MLLDPFVSENILKLTTLVEAIKILPNSYGKINTSGIFKERPVNTRTIIIEMKDGVLNLLPTKPVGAPGSELNRGLRNARPLIVPHIPAHDVILPQELEGIRAFGKEDQVAALSDIVAEHLQNAKDKFFITKEYHRIRAIQGSVLDADGSTVLFNWFNEFMMKQMSFEFDFTGTADPLATILNLKRYFESHLKGETMTGVHVYCDKDFFNALTTFSVTKTAFDRYQDSALFRTDVRNRFEYGGVVFEEYEGTADDRDGVAHKFIASKEAYAYPLGTTQTFRTYFAPANRFSTINKPGQELSVWRKMRDDESGIDFWFESNPIHVVLRPELTVKLTAKTS